MPRFEDYNRTIVGYHGTRASVAEALVLGRREFDFSRNDHDWLGHGIYFWEHAPQQAWWWAKRRKKKQNWDEEPAVVASMIRLGNCFDLLDPYNLRYLESMHEQFRGVMDDAGQAVPRNYNHRKFLDCAVFQYAYLAVEADGSPVDTARAVYVPTGKDRRVWARSWICRSAHIQVCVRNPKCILGTWLVRSSEDAEAV